LSKFDISSNGLRAEGGKALAAGIKGNQVITELNISSNEMGYNFNADTDTSGIIAIADAIPDMGALTKFDISKNDLMAEGGKALAVGLKGNQVVTELNVAGNRLGQRYSVSIGGYVTDMSGVTALADAIPDMRALLSLNLASNNIGGSYNDYGEFTATSEGAVRASIVMVLILDNFHRSSCYRECHQGYEGTIVAESGFKFSLRCR
jgi:hypothetical protein